MAMEKSLSFRAERVLTDFCIVLPSLHLSCLKEFPQVAHYQREYQNEAGNHILIIEFQVQHVQHILHKAQQKSSKEHADDVAFSARHEGSAQNNRANAIDAVRCASRTGTDQGAGSGNDAADHCENTGTDITEEVDPFHRNTRYLCNRCVRAACSDIDAETSVFVYQIPRNQQYCHNPDRIRNSEDGTAGDHFE